MDPCFPGKKDLFGRMWFIFPEISAGSLLPREGQNGSRNIWNDGIYLPKNLCWIPASLGRAEGWRTGQEFLVLHSSPVSVILYLSLFISPTCPHPSVQGWASSWDPSTPGREFLTLDQIILWLFPPPACDPCSSRLRIEAKLRLTNREPREAPLSKSSWSHSAVSFLDQRGFLCFFFILITPKTCPP